MSAVMKVTVECRRIRPCEPLQAKNSPYSRSLRHEARDNDQAAVEDTISIQTGDGDGYCD